MVEPIIPSNQTIKPDASGNATRWHGYVAREGFGITRIKNQIRANSPVIGNNHFSQQNLLLCSMGLSVLGQTGGVSLLRENSIFTTSRTFWLDVAETRRLNIVYG